MSKPRRLPALQKLTPFTPSVVAFREFSIITEDTIVTERRRFRAQIADEIESFSKRAAVRNLKTNGKFTKDQISIIYGQSSAYPSSLPDLEYPDPLLHEYADKFFAALCTADPTKDGQVSGNSTPPGAANPADEGRIETRIDLRTFRWVSFLLSIQACA